MTKANSNLHRAAALLAALCLLASMALPVYAAETETDFSVSNSETIPDDDNTGNGADGTGSDISVSNLETIQKDADTTNEGSKTEPEISVPESGTIPSGADTTDKAAGAPPAEGVTGSENTAPADNAAADKTADADKTGEDSTGGEDEAGFLNEDDSADDRMITAGNAKESDIVLCADNATVQKGTKYTFYFAPPKDWVDLLSDKAITCSFMRGNTNDNPPSPKHEVRTTTATLITDKTTDNRPIYQVDVYHNNDDANSLCPYGGFVWVRFTLDENHWVTMKGEREGENSNNYWMEVGKIANKCLDGNQLTGNTENIYDYDIDKWVPYADITPKHVRYCGERMTLLNKSAQALDNVTVTFWEKDADGNLTQVGSQQVIQSLQPNDKSEDITIPETACAYVSFQKSDGAGNNTYIGKQYFNFYNDEDPSDNIAVFPYDPVTRYCLIYTGDNDVRWSAPNSKTVYFDATFSDMSYKNDSATTYGMPDADGNLWCYITSDDSSKEPITKLQMARDGTSEIWYVDVPQGYTKIRFASWAVDGTNTANNGTDTVLLTIPDLNKPCFYADTSDDVIYQGGNRGGYWDELGAIRDAENGKKAAGGSAKSIVELDKQAFTPQSNTKYISTTLYDYYTDYELNGNNRNTYSSTETGTHRSYVPFRQFDRALSNYYSSYTGNPKIQNPIYTGHFQPNKDGWGSPFSNIAANLNLYGWGEITASDNSDYKHFMAVNNSTINTKDDSVNYYAAFQGLVGNQMVNGMPVMAGTNLAEPHFNEAFLTGTNAEKAVLGKVYKDVSFPFTQKPVFTQTEGDLESKAQYWYFDSNERSLYLKQDTANSSKYYLEATAKAEKDSSGNPIYTDDNSQNRGSDNSTTDSNNGDKPRGFGFFPFNQKMGTENRNVNKYNYGFGAKLQFDFTLTDDGNVVVGTDENGKDIKVPIKFFFSGDDDVWVYIDGQMVLDVGGAHGKASGLLEFGDNGTANTVTPYVSSNKAGGATYTTNVNNKTVYFNGKEVKFEKKGEIVDKDGNPFTLDKGTTHTLTMFYMERGMWESNMAVAFNFPDHNELQVEKKVDLSDVDTAFQACFNDQKIFDFTIQNLATHYGAKEAVRPGTGNVDRKVVDLTASGTRIYPATDSEDYIFALADNPKKDSESDTGQVLHWFARYNDLNSAYRNMRYGILKLNSPIDLSQYGYLTFEIYVKGDTNLSLNNLYLQLLDDGDRQMGSLSKAGLNGATFGSVTLEPNKWNTVKLSLNKMNAVDGFDNKVTTIRVGDNYQRDIYFRNFTFVPKTVPDIKTGFTTEQDKIPDYGSAASGTLKNATYAKYTSNFDGMQVVDDQGRFVLENGEIITFNDQFRRGSYISLKEILNTKLYDTKWTVYENGLPVTSMKGDGVKTVTVEDKSKSLEKQPTSGPDDGRTEKKGTEAEQKDNKYSDTKPTDANTIVFRSYSNPDESGDSLTSLKVQYINKVKTGGLIIKKAAATGEPLKGIYEFKVTFSDVGGQGLETGDPIVKTYPINMSDTDTVTITGIPVDTRYTIEELEPKDGSHLQGITLVGDENNAHVVNNTTVEGVIVESKTPQMTATFTNTKRTLIDIAFTKLWQDADGKPLGSAKQPSEIYIQLQRRLENSSEKDHWEAVKYPATGSANYVTVNSINDRWKYSFKGLDQRRAGGTTNYVYRIVEGTRGTDDTFNVADGSIPIGGNTYTISAEASLTGTAGSAANGTITGGSGKIELTNKLQDPKFTLNIVKKGVTTAENGSETQTPLGGVEFKLERLKESSGSGKPQVDTTYDFGSENIGSITGITGEGGTIANNPFKDLKAGSYQLTEVKTAEGYNLLSEPIQIKFTTDGECYIDGVKDETNVTRTGDTCTMTLTVLNRKSFELPHTGADAPSLWLLIGLPALVAVLLVLVFRYNKKGGRRQ
ncbi:MAG: SpaA isopeptide-forming pilin-related protein [Gemmiger sp.]|uniref:SpaA isopeptide-forming pilin-related protein n=1 Tax=Gemmiger sp. TaxID=2049027 RepID=UPI002E79F071|nr:SpaA isopeptide-forming pilin-related protein [Gemmiger sp.]MEE0098985.1 SpaA isopeptide-forming pilin-related protein [Gemmiger sp.]